METPEFIRLYPRLFHMAAAGSWPSIQRLGLLSTTALAARWEADADVSTLRPDSIVLEHPEFGTAIVRDQKPIHAPSLEIALGGEMTLAEWLAELNSRVFFFAREDALHGLMNSPAYRKDEHDVLTVDTASLVEAHAERIQLTGMNTGFARPHARKARGRGTFQAIADYEHPRRTRILASTRDLVEVCIPDAVPDIAAHVTRVVRMRRGEELQTLYSR